MGNKTGNTVTLKDNEWFNGVHFDVDSENELLGVTISNEDTIAVLRVGEADVAFEEAIKMLAISNGLVGDKIKAGDVDGITFDTEREPDCDIVESVAEVNAKISGGNYIDDGGYKIKVVYYETQEALAKAVSEYFYESPLVNFGSNLASHEITSKGISIEGKDFCKVFFNLGDVYYLNGEPDLADKVVSWEQANALHLHNYAKDIDDGMAMVSELFAKYPVIRPLTLNIVASKKNIYGVLLYTYAKLAHQILSLDKGSDVDIEGLDELLHPCSILSTRVLDEEEAFTHTHSLFLKTPSYARGTTTDKSVTLTEGNNDLEHYHRTMIYLTLGGFLDFASRGAYKCIAEQ